MATDFYAKYRSGKRAEKEQQAFSDAFQRAYLRFDADDALKRRIRDFFDAYGEYDQELRELDLAGEFLEEFGLARLSGEISAFLELIAVLRKER